MGIFKYPLTISDELLILFVLKDAFPTGLVFNINI